MSTRNTSGRPKAPHTEMKCATFSQAGLSSVPAICMGWLAIMPTGRPPSRASMVTTLRA